MNCIKYSVIIFSMLCLIGCSNDEKSLEVYAQGNSINHSMSVAGNTVEIELKFNVPIAEITDVNIGQREASFELKEDCLIIKIQQNDTDNDVIIPITISWGNDVKKFDIIQTVKTNITNAQSYYIFPAQGGLCTIEIDLSADVKCEYQMIYDGEVFASIDNAKQAGKHIILTLDMTANAHFGRACGLRVIPYGGDEKTIGIWQQPREFTEAESLSVDKSGTLGVMLGDDIRNIARIHKLSISGHLNGNDAAVIKKLFNKYTYNGIAHPIIDLDMKWANIVEDSKCTAYYESFGGIGSIYGDDKVYTLGNTIPTHLFSGSENLGSIILPASVKTIGRYAFGYCTNIKNVTLPMDCKRIEDYAFFNCSNLTHIEMKYPGDYCRITHIGDYAFSGIGRLDYFILSEELTGLTSSSLLGFSVDKLYALWLTPPAINIYGIVNGCILYVPIGSIDAYHSSEQWSKFTDIREFDNMNDDIL